MAFEYDPHRPVPTAGGAHVGMLEMVIPEGETLPPVPPFGQRVSTYGKYLRSVIPVGPINQVESEDMIGIEAPFVALADRPDVLVFQTMPLEEDIEVTGVSQVLLWISSTTPDTDFTVKLVDVYPPSRDYPSGYDLLIADSIMRCRYRNSSTRPELMSPGQVYKVEIALPPTSNVFATGHRIRIDVSSSNFPKYDVNPNTGELPGRQTRVNTAINSVYMCADTPSHVVLPVIPDSH